MKVLESMLTSHVTTGEHIELIFLLALTKGSEIIREYIANQLIPSAISYFQATLKVIREQKPLTVDFECGELIPPRYLTTTGVNADLILLVTGDYFQESFVAAAVPCALAEPTNRY